jgi:hypothetical protein
MMFSNRLQHAGRSELDLCGVLLALSTALAACGSDAPATAGPCGRGELPACGTSCSSLSVCPTGLHCTEGACQAECTSASAAQDCGRGKLCNDDGRCMDDPDAEEDGGEDGPDGGSAGGSGGGDGGGGLGGSGLDGGEDSQVCGRVVLDTTPKTPNVMLIIDRSSSMDEPFGSADRWTALKDSLLAPNGMIAELQNVVRFGATWYSASNGQDVPAIAECPVLVEVNIALDNFEAIRTGYPADMIEDTPTGDSIEAVLAKLTNNGLDPPSSQDPTIFILATDGEPDTCEQLDPQNGQQESIDAVKHAFTLGIKTYVIAVANEGDLSQQHLNDLANAGVGNMGGPQAPSYRPNSDQGLRDALRDIISGVVSCDVRLEGTVTGEPCEAEVTIGATRLTCNDANGFELLGPSEVRLNGNACEELKAGKGLTASFPCGGAIPIL